MARWALGGRPAGAAEPAPCCPPRIAGKLESTSWECIGGNYAIFFFFHEVEDEGVLELIRQHDLKDYFEIRAGSASEAGDAHLCADWVHRL